MEQYNLRETISQIAQLIVADTFFLATLQAVSAVPSSKLSFIVTAQVLQRQSGQLEARNQALGIAGQGLQQVPALLSRG